MPAPGAYAAPNWANSQRVGDVGTKATLMLLAAYADESFSCYPGQERIADETEQSVRTVRRQLDLLEEVGLIGREPRYVFSEASGKRVRTSDRFFLRLDVTVSKADVSAAQERITAGTSTRKAGRSKSGAPAPDLAANLAGRSDEHLAANLAGRSDEHLAANLAGRSDEHLAANLTGRSDDAPTGQIEHTYRPKSTSTPDTSDRVTPRGTPRRTPRRTSTSGRDVAAVDNSTGETSSGAQETRSPAVDGSVLQFPSALDDAEVDWDEVDRVMACLPDRLQPTQAEARRLRGLVVQRMQLGWTRDGILDAVQHGLRPGGRLDNPCGLFARTLVPLQAPAASRVRQQEALVAPEDPWCGTCDKLTRRVLDDAGYPDPTQPKCAECAQLAFVHHMERGAS